MKNVAKVLQMLEESVDNSTDVFIQYVNKNKLPKKAKESLLALSELSKQPEVDYKVFGKVLSGLSAWRFPLANLGLKAEGKTYQEKVSKEIGRLGEKYSVPASVINLEGVWSKDDEKLIRDLIEKHKEEGYFSFARPGQIPISLETYKDLSKNGLRPSTSGNHGFTFYEGYEKWVKEYLKTAIDSIPILEKHNEVEAINALKDSVAKLQQTLPIFDGVAQIRAKILDPKVVKQRQKEQAAKGKVNPEIYEQVKVIAEDFRKIIEQNWVEYFNTKIAEYQKAVKATGGKNIYEVFPINNKVKSKRDRNLTAADLEAIKQNERNNKYQKLYSEITKTYPIDDNIVNRISNFTTVVKTPQEIQKMAFDKSSHEAAQFLFKMADKLGGLFSDISVSLDITQVPNSLSASRALKSNTLFFKINKGESRFYIQNSIVFAHSVLGTPFYRYPSTFHDLFVKGVKIKYPDERIVKLELNKAYGA